MVANRTSSMPTALPASRAITTVSCRALPSASTNSLEGPRELPPGGGRRASRSFTNISCSLGASLSSTQTALYLSMRMIT